jgi:hypothetical protein
MSRLRVLVLAPECNPGCLTNPSIGYYEGQALARIHEVTMVLHAESEGAVRRAVGSFHAIEPIRVPLLDGLYEWMLRRVLPLADLIPDFCPPT